MTTLEKEGIYLKKVISRVLMNGENIETLMPVITHYLNNDIDTNILTNEDAILVLNNVINENRNNEKFSKNIAEEASQYLLFKETDKDIPFKPNKDSNFTFIDLFAGIGGFRIAMQELGGRCVFSSEWDEYAKKTYYANFGEIPFGDITKEETKKYIPENFDILCAGFPCQAFSIAGYQKGFSDTRGTLFFDIEQIVERHRPKVVFLENVKNLVSHDKGRTFKVIIEILEKKLGYKIFHIVLNTMNYVDIPQNRERVFLVAFEPDKVKNYSKFAFPEPIKLNRSIRDFLSTSKVDDKYYYKKDHKYYPELIKAINNTDTVYQWRRIYVRENKNNVCPTLTANMGTGGHNVPLIKDRYGIRKLTPKECFALQGYPMDKFKFPNISDSKLYMQAGNSVTTSLVKRISQEVINVL
jgi:DNA (cytosine-5)-methyltransferase 1